MQFIATMIIKKRRTLYLLYLKTAKTLMTVSQKPTKGIFLHFLQKKVPTSSPLFLAI